MVDSVKALKRSVNLFFALSPFIQGRKLDTLKKHTVCQCYQLLTDNIFSSSVAGKKGKLRCCGRQPPTFAVLTYLALTPTSTIY